MDPEPAQPPSSAHWHVISSAPAMHAPRELEAAEPAAPCSPSRHGSFDLACTRAFRVACQCSMHGRVPGIDDARWHGIFPRPGFEAAAEIAGEMRESSPEQPPPRGLCGDTLPATNPTQSHNKLRVNLTRNLNLTSRIKLHRAHVRASSW